MLNLYFVYSYSNSISNVSFHADNNEYGIPVCRNEIFSTVFSSRELEELLKAELCRIREEATLYVSVFFDTAMVQRVVDSLNHGGWCFHIGTGSSDLSGLEIMSCCNCRDYES